MKRRRSVIRHAMVVVSAAVMLGSVVPSVSAAGPQDVHRINGARGRLEIASQARVKNLDKFRPDGTMASVIIKLDVAPVASYTGGVSGLAATQAIVQEGRQDASAKQTLAQYEAHVQRAQSAFEARLERAIPRARVIYRLTWAYGGVTARIPSGRLAEVSRMPGVVSVSRDRLLELDTERSPQFIGAPTTWGKLGGQGKAGEGVIVGVLDTGIWPEHPSYSDPDPLGKAYAAPPPAPDGSRACEFSGGSNPGPAFSCNNKLIGADRFMATYDFFVGIGPEEFTSARDDDGHGTHTSSTAAGNRGVDAEIFGVDRGTISGIAPRAHVMMYKVCGAEGGCFASDSAAAVDEAIQDGVDVINFSIGGGENPYEDAVSLAFLDAYSAGIFVAASAGNDGPGADTVGHREPWVTTVAASTTDRAFQTTVTLSSNTAGDVELVGDSVTAGLSATPVVNAADAPYNDALCEDSPSDGAFDGVVVICQRGGNGRAEKGFNVLQRGAAGMLLYNPAGITDVETDNHWLPTVHLNVPAGADLIDYFVANSNVTATWGPSVPTTVQGDIVASFSSRGGPAQALGISKPDVSAPGVQILAGASPQHVDVAGGPDGELFQAIAGTSMASPHVAGAAALLTDLHPSWKPGQIKSALMTSAFQGVLDSDGASDTDPFDDGSGRINLARAWNPGLSFSTAGSNYVVNQDNLFLSNYPSIYVPDMPGIVTMTRRAHSELSEARSWSISVQSPSDLDITVPGSISIGAGGDRLFDIRLDASTVPLGEVRHGVIVFTSGSLKARMPVTIVRGEGPVTVDKECSPTSVPQGTLTDCTIDITNTTFEGVQVTLRDRLPSELKIRPNTISGASQAGNGVWAYTTLGAGDPPATSVVAGPGDGYVDASGGALDTDLTDESWADITFSGTVFFGGQEWDHVSMVSNGYAVVGSANGADVSFVNSNFPDADAPNGTLAPFWTDLDPGSGGETFVNIFGSGTGDCFDATPTDSCYLVFEWQGVPEYSTHANTHTFQVWLGYYSDATPVEETYFFYGANTGTGDLGFLTVGAENQYGNRGQAVYFDGDTPANVPADGDSWEVLSDAGAPGETYTVEFSARGAHQGAWTNCAVIRSTSFYGRGVDCESGTVGP